MFVEIAVLLGRRAPGGARKREVEHQRRLVRPCREEQLGVFVECSAPAFKHWLEERARSPLKSAHPAAVALVLANAPHFKAKRCSPAGLVLQDLAVLVGVGARVLADYIGDNLAEPKRERVLLGHVGVPAENAGTPSRLVRATIYLTHPALSSTLTL